MVTILFIPKPKKCTIPPQFLLRRDNKIRTDNKIYLLIYSSIIMKIPLIFLIILIPGMLIAGCLAPSHSEMPPPSPTPFVPDGKMTVHFIDVGQGDSELIESPSGIIMLIDAGPPEAGTKVGQYLRTQGISSIDILVISNPHDDHIGGMPAIVDAFSIKHVIDGGFGNSSEAYDRLIASIRQRNISIREVREGDSVSFDPKVSVQVLNPTLNRSTDINQNSLVLKMTFVKDTFLFTSDAGGEAEMRYAKSVGHIEVLKVADHGSENSSSKEFLSVVTPVSSFIEVGTGNIFGYPAASTLERLKQARVANYQTDFLGTIKVSSNGFNMLHVEAEKFKFVTPVPSGKLL
jgi:competence protein ComEC